VSAVARVLLRARAAVAFALVVRLLIAADVVLAGLIEVALFL
jgi:hypothetical protein